MARTVDGTAESVGGDHARRSRAGSPGGGSHRAGLVIGVVGDMTKTEAAALVDRIFGGLAGGRRARPQIAEARAAREWRVLISRRRGAAKRVTFGQGGPKRDDPDWYAARLVNDILGGGGFRGRLMKEIREKRGLAYGVSTRTRARSAMPG